MFSSVPRIALCRAKFDRSAIIYIGRHFEILSWSKSSTNLTFIFATEQILSMYWVWVRFNIVFSLIIWKRKISWKSAEIEMVILKWSRQMRWYFNLTLLWFTQTCITYWTLKKLQLRCDRPKTNKNVNSRHSQADQSILSILLLFMFNLAYQSNSFNCSIRTLNIYSYYPYTKILSLSK